MEISYTIRGITLNKSEIADIATDCRNVCEPSNSISCSLYGKHASHNPF